MPPRWTCLHEATRGKLKQETRRCFEKTKMRQQVWEWLSPIMDTFWVLVGGCARDLGLGDVPGRTLFTVYDSFQDM